LKVTAWYDTSTAEEYSLILVVPATGFVNGSMLCAASCNSSLCARNLAFAIKGWARQVIVLSKAYWLIGSTASMVDSAL
jgi:hypothetical protein